MKKCICYYKESEEENMSAVYLEDSTNSVCIFLLEEQKSALEFVDDIKHKNITPVAPVSDSVDNLIKLKNAGFTAEEIISIKKAGI